MKQYFVDVWQGHLTPEAETLQHLAGLLDDNERQKARSFRLPVMSDRYIATRGLLRRTLAAYLQADPASLQFETGAYGKPGLVGGGLYFNLSHTADSLLIAVANFADIGIDIEAIKSRNGLLGIAERCFSAREFDGWQRLSPDRQLECFYRLWTKKEAFVKAVGRGIALGVEQCEVELEKGGGLLAIPEEYGPASGWTVSELPVGEGVCAALVTANCRFILRRRLLDAVAERAAGCC